MLRFTLSKIMKNCTIKLKLLYKLRDLTTNRSLLFCLFSYVEYLYFYKAL